VGAREPGGRAIYDSLIVNTHLAASIIFGLAVLYLLAGLGAFVVAGLVLVAIIR
jgi:hypothetical protein